jgi:hypothetical protein
MSFFVREFFRYPVGVTCPTGLFGNSYATGIAVHIVPGWDRPGAWSKSDECDTLTSSGMLRLIVGNRTHFNGAPLASMPAGFLAPSRFFKSRQPIEPHAPLTTLFNILKEEMKEYAPKPMEITPVYIGSQEPFIIEISYSRSLKIARDALMG